MSKAKQNLHPFARFTFLVYVGLMVWLLFGRPRAWSEELTYAEILRQNINLTPLLTIRNYLQVVLHRTNDAVLMHCIINLVGNVVLFLPPGWLLPHIWVRFRNFFRFFFTCLAAILLVEITQLLTLLGSFDIDDVILNMAALVIGYLAYMLTHPGKKKSVRGKQRSNDRK